MVGRSQVKPELAPPPPPPFKGCHHVSEAQPENHIEAL